MLAGRSGAKITAKIREIGSRPAARLPNDAPIVARIRAVDAHLGIRSRLDCASTDANIPLSHGDSGGLHRRGRTGRRRPYHLRVVSRPTGRDLGLKRILLTAALLLLQAIAHTEFVNSLCAPSWPSLGRDHVVWGTTFVVVKRRWRMFRRSFSLPCGFRWLPWRWC